MDYKIKNLENSKVELNISLNKEEWQEELNNAYSKNKNKYTVQGFRKGAAPRKMIEANYGEYVFYNEALENVYYTRFDEIVLKEKLEIVTPPELTVNKMDAEGLEITLSFELKPEVKLGEYKNLGIKKEEVKIDDALLQAEIAVNLDKASRLVEVEREAKLGDTVNLDFLGKVDGVEFAGGKAENYDLVLGSHSFIDNFEDQLVGLKKGDEKDVNVTFPKEYGEKTLAGKPAIFSCKINEVREKELPELTEEFVKETSEFETVEEYKEDVKKKLVEEKEKEAKINFENQLFDKVSENAEVYISDAIVDEEIHGMLHSFEERLSMQGIKLEDYFTYTGTTIEDYKNSMRETAKKNVKMRLVIEALLKKENIVVKDEDVKAYIEDLAKKNGKKFEDMDKIMNSEHKNQIASNLLIEKLIEFLTENN